MSDWYLFRQTDPYGRFNQQILTGITDSQINTILAIAVGKVEVFKGTIDSSVALVDKPKVLNRQTFSCGKNLLGSRYKRTTFTLKDMLDDKTVNDVRAVMSSLDCHEDVNEPAEYVNLINDSKE